MFSKVIPLRLASALFLFLVPQASPSELFQAPQNYDSGDRGIYSGAQSVAVGDVNGGRQTRPARRQSLQWLWQRSGGRAPRQR